jgi:hypothetical protein
MIHAICLKCGTGKAGAMAQCPRCGFKPEATEDKAKSILLSDRCAQMPVLKKVAQRLAKGEKLKFDEADVHKWSDVLEAEPRPVVKRMGLTPRQWTLVGVAIGAGVVFGFCIAGVMLLQ